MQIPVAFDKVVTLAETLGVQRINELPGAWLCVVDPNWTFALNGTGEPVTVDVKDGMGIQSLKPFEMAVWFNGWLAGLIGFNGGTMCAGEAGNEDRFIKAVEDRIEVERLAKRMRSDDAASVQKGGSVMTAPISPNPASSSPAVRQGGLIKLNDRQQMLIKEWSADSPHGDLWGNDEARAINLATFARSILAAVRQGEEEARASGIKMRHSPHPPKQKRSCVVCGARVRNINPKVVTCSPDCTAKHHGRPAPEVRPVETCKHCGKPCSDDEGTVCDECYSKYTPGMLADLEG